MYIVLSGRVAIAIASELDKRESMVALMEAGYPDNLIVEVCREAVEKQVTSFGWVSKAVQSRAARASTIKPAPVTKETKPWDNAA